MSAKDSHAEGAGAERGSGRRFAIILALSILLLFALTVGALYAIFNGRLRRTAPQRSAAPYFNETASAAGSETQGCKPRRLALPEEYACSVHSTQT